MPVKDLKLGQSVSETFLITDLKQGVTKKGGAYVSCKLRDKTGEVPATLWDYGTSSAHDLIKDGGLIHVGGLVGEYKGTLQINIQTVGAPQTTDMRLFEKRTSYDVSELQQSLRCMVALIESDPIRDIAERFINGPLFENFSEAPAATDMHHAFLGGLIEHTVEMMETARKLFELPFYKDKLNKDLVMFGLLFHDFGKIFEYRNDSGFKKKVGGVLVGHIPKMAALIYHTCQQLQIPEILTDSLMHVVLAHHRFLKWGSPNAPAYPEALFIHYVDNLHGDVMGVIQKIEGDNSESETVKFGFGDESYTIIKRRFGDILKEAEEEYHDRRPNSTGAVHGSEDKPAGEQDSLGGF